MLKHGEIIECKAVSSTQRHGHDACALDARGNLIHFKGGWADDDAIATSPAKSPDEKINGLITPASHEQPIAWHLVQDGEPFQQRARLSFRIAIKACDRFIFWRTPRQLIGMQSFQPRLPRSMLIGLQREDLRSCQLTHPAHRSDRQV